MTIIISKEGSKAERVDKSPFPDEAYLQEYIYQNPESLPLYEIDADIRLLVLAREFPTNSGPIDALGVDAAGEIYIVETKLYKNPDKRLVVAQILDYGASMWKTYSDTREFRARLDRMVTDKFGASAVSKLADFFETEDADASAILDTMEQNVSDGRFRFVVLMDKLDARLKDIIVFLNQNSRFDLYGVEIDHYKFEQHEIMIPRLYGAEVKKVVSRGGTAARKKWDKASIQEELATPEMSTMRRHIDALTSVSEASPDTIVIDYGTGRNGSVIFRNRAGKSLVSVDLTGKVWLSETRKAHFQQLQTLAGKYTQRLQWRNIEEGKWASLEANLNDVSDEDAQALCDFLVELGETIKGKIAGSDC